MKSSSSPAGKRSKYKINCAILHNTGENQVKKGVKNSELNQFKPGESGNPNGRPKKLPSLDKLLPEVLGEEIDDNSKIKQILNKLADVAIKKGDTRAAQILLDRGWGAAKQSVTVDQEVVITIKRES